MLAMGEKRPALEKFAEIDPKSGAPKMANTLLACLTIVGPFLGKKMLVPLTNVSALAFIFSCTMVGFACLRMRTTEPDLPRPYKVPGGSAGNRSRLSGWFHYYRIDGYSDEPGGLTGRVADRGGLADRWSHFKNVFSEKIIYQTLKGGFTMKKELKDTAFVGGLLIDGTGAEPVKIPWFW